jgi:hypothetical protein
MNSYLDTIDAAIANVHSRWQDPYPYSLKEYERDLQNLIELRSFIEFVFDVEEEK